MLWALGRNFQRVRTSPIETLLGKPDVSLEEIISEEEVISEVKLPNQKLIQFLNSQSSVEKLLEYVVAEQPPSAGSTVLDPMDGSDIDSNASVPSSPAPFSSDDSTPMADKMAMSSSAMVDISKGTAPAPAGSQYGPAGDTIDPVADDDDDGKDLGDIHQDMDSENKRMKLAFTACEILLVYPPLLSTALRQNPDSIRRFWEFVSSPRMLDPIQSSYFSKVNEILFHNETADMIELFKSIDGVVPKMLQHIESPIIMDLLLKIISLEQEDGFGAGIVDWLQYQGMIPILLSYLKPGQDDSKQTAAGDYLKAIITMSANAAPQDQAAIGPNELTRQLVSEQCVNELIECMLAGGNSLTVGVGIVIEVIRKNNSDYDTAKQTEEPPRTSDPIYLGGLLKCFADRIPDFMKILRTSPKKEGSSSEPKILRSAYGESYEPLGFSRFKTCELMAELLHCSNMKLLNTKGAASEVKRRDAQRERIKRGEAGTSDDILLGLDLDSAINNYCSSNQDSTLTPSGLGESSERSGVVTAQQSPSNTLIQPPIVSPTSAKLTEIVQKLELGPELGESSPTPMTDEPDDPSIDRPRPLFAPRPETPPEKSSLEESSKIAPEKDASPKKETNSETEGQGVDPEIEDDEVPRPAYEVDDDGSPVVGDYLKIMFVEHQVITTVIDFLFRFPWNNFLHNVVFDVVQQIFTGTMESGYNSSLVTDVFGPGRLTERIIEGQAENDSLQQNGMARLGYMGHLTLISAEVIKFTETYNPVSLPKTVADKITSEEWVHYIEEPFMNTRERDNAILGGIRPEASTYPISMGADGGVGGMEEFSSSDKLFPSLFSLADMDGEESSQMWGGAETLELSEDDQVGEVSFEMDTI